MDAIVTHAYQYCQTLARSHYENFPIASYFLPKKIRLAIMAIYAFARTADDLADEGTATEVQRLYHLSQYENHLESIQQRTSLPTDPIFIALQHTIETHHLPISLFFDLLRAFKQDVAKKVYMNFDEILDYCQLSANPIGRLLLHLTQQDTEKNLQYSDHLCTALQLINFMQDIYSDISLRKRCYFPQNEMADRQLTPEYLIEKNHTQANLFLKSQMARIQSILDQGRPLYHGLKGLFAFEILLVIQGGQKVLDKLVKRHSPRTRPVLTFLDWIQIFSKSCLEFL